MKLKRIALSMIIILIAIFMLSAWNEVHAVDSSMYLKIVMLRSNNGYGYKFSEKNIWKIVKTDSSGHTTDYTKTLYCLKGGQGFGSSEGKKEQKNYTQHFDMKNLNTIDESYKNQLPSNGTYKSLLWLLDNLWVRPSKTSANDEVAKEYWNVLMDEAGVDGDIILEDDVDAVQQLAIWHFTNKNDGWSVDENGTFEFWTNFTQGVDNDYRPLSDDHADGHDRAQECQALYDYLVGKAEEHSDYVPQEASKPYELDKGITATIQEVNNKYKIGPFKIKKLSDTSSNLTVTFKNGESKITNPNLQDNSGRTIRVNELKDKTGQEFYLILPKSTTLNTIKLEIGGSYFSTTITYWSVQNAPSTDQPVVEVEKTKVPYQDTMEVTPKAPDTPDKKFDLALRKFIIKVNDNDLKDASGKYLREPKVDVSPLTSKSGTTAKYEHPKTPVVVKTNDIVTYAIRVYNEGEVDGIVKEITDFLPDGLEFVTNQFNTDNGWTAEGQKVTTHKLDRQVISAYTGSGTPSYKEVQIQCKVVATLEENSQDLKNIAEITNQTDKDGKTVTDRDSEPKTVDPKQYPEDHNIQDDDDYEDLIIPNGTFDLALRKFIIAVNEQELRDSTTNKYTREPKVDITPLTTGMSTTANYTHPKTPVTIKKGDKVTYIIRVYNEGEIDAIVKEITDYLPDGLKLATNSTINTQNKWKASADGKTITTDALAGTVIPAFDGEHEPSHLDVKIECEVIATPGEENEKLKNIAEITNQTDEEGKPQTDRDSQPGTVDPDKYPDNKNIQDDDDYEDLVLLGQYFDLSLRKFITAVNDDELTGDDGTYLREPIVDVSPLVSGSDTTARYEHPKTPVHVAVGDTVIYTIRVYNEGQIDGYVKEITDHLPEYLEFVNDEFNASYGWEIDDERTIHTTITSPDTTYNANRDKIYADRKEGNDKVILEAFDPEKGELDYIDVKIKCVVKDSGIAEVLTNIADITDFSDEEGKDVTDRDSQKDNVTLPSDETLPDYSNHQQDDDDFEKVIIEKFDLALRKFITQVNDQEITNRIPVFTVDENRNYKYEHTKKPVEVATGDIVVYTIRVFNEGNMAGYAQEVKDDLPDGLEFLPDHEINKEYRWKMYTEAGEETTNKSEATNIRTDYLSKEQEDETKRDNKLEAFNVNSMTMPDYKDLKIAFKVTEPNTSDRILTNIAEITDDADENGNPVEDVDSEPDNDDEDEDDIDEEKVKVKYFDLSLEKIISKLTVTLDGKTVVTETKHKFGVKPEPVVKLELKTHSIENAVIKFTYQIRVTNEGEVEGYVKEIRDYIPKGLKFEAKDNPKWKLSEDGKTVTTDQLKDTLLQPGESKTVEVTFRWINGHNNLGTKTNIAEISDDYNDHDDTDDIDSTPDNKKDGEDDIDDAQVVLSVVTGSMTSTYVIMTTVVLSILAGGLILIKKFVI